ncbi:MAG: tRNA uridine-5-carboxymethylaminomethyl(34) synthesis GTPase MnmE [Candidatus Sericytochromatia bacterium]|nr:tRNA uridine-5-carboxymethylaminomethyl(34) synthesis GTPase MnmE [Candidatus Sericytochromatia bacterium]
MNETIAAIATPLGTAAIGVVRLSGPESLRIARAIFFPRKAWRDDAPQSHRAYFGSLQHPQTGAALDQGLFLWMREPHSYTGEDSVELHCHGGSFVLQAVLNACLLAGARLAEAGEFTQRAFINGKLDLVQAEAVADLIHSRSEPGMALAAHQLEGQLSGQLRQIRQQLIAMLATIEANIDFPDEVDSPDYAAIEAELQVIQQAIRDLLASADSGRVWKQGLRLALVGTPNVGKSTLLNALLRYERAIVSPIPGTTRDTVEDDYSLKGIPIRLIDTAGLRESDDQIEAIGMARSREALANADLILLVSEAGQAIPSDLQQLVQSLSKPWVVQVENKQDLQNEMSAAPLQPDWPIYRISALQQQGLEDLEAGLYQLITQKLNLSSPVSVNARHSLCLVRAAEALERMQETLQQGLPGDFASIDLKEAIVAFGEVLGESISETVIHEIFHRFCVGK